MTVSVTPGNRSLASLLREARGDMSMRELARKSGLSPAQISRIEAGDVERPNAETLSQLARALDRSSQLLLAALDRLPEPEAFNAVLLALVDEIPWVKGEGELEFDIAPEADPDLVATLLALLDQRRGVDDLRVQGLNLDGEAAGELQVLDSWREALAEANERAVAVELSAGAAEGELAEAGRRLAEARQRVEESNAAVADVRREIQQHQRALDSAEGRLASAVRDLAAQLFIRRRPIPQGIWEWSEHDRPDITPEAREQLKQMLARIRREPLASEDLGSLAEFLALFSDIGEDPLVDARRRLTSLPNDRQFREVARVWERLTPERKRRVVEFAQDQHRLSVHELVEEQREEARSTLRSDPEGEGAEDVS